jgi:hypothetical protein
MYQTREQKNWVPVVIRATLHVVAQFWPFVEMFRTSISSPGACYRVKIFEPYMLSMALETARRARTNKLLSERSAFPTDTPDEIVSAKRFSIDKMRFDPVLKQMYHLANPSLRMHGGTNGVVLRDGTVLFLPHTRAATALFPRAQCVAERETHLGWCALPPRRRGTSPCMYMRAYPFFYHMMFVLFRPEGEGFIVSKVSPLFQPPLRTRLTYAAKIAFPMSLALQDDTDTLVIAYGDSDQRAAWFTLPLRSVLDCMLMPLTYDFNGTLIHDVPDILERLLAACPAHTNARK